MAAKDSPAPQVREFHRLSSDQYAELEKQVAINPFVSANTTDLQAGQMVGVAFVLKKLRDGFVVDA